MRSGQDAFSGADSTESDYKACGRPEPACRTKEREGGLVMTDRVALVGVDWGDKQHAFEIRGGDGRRRRGSFESRPEAVHAWVAELRGEYPKGTIAIALEQSRGALIYALSRYDFIELVPVQPARSAVYRKIARPSGAKSDPIDAGLVCDYVEKHGETIKAIAPTDPLTCELLLLSEWRRKF